MKKEKKINKNFIIVICSIIINFIASTVQIAFFRDIFLFGGINFSGFIRFFLLYVLLIILLGNFSKYFIYIQKEKKLLIFLILFILLIILQFTIDNSIKELQGNIKYLFYFIVISILLFSSFFYSKYVITIMNKLAIIFFLLVILPYFYIIYINPIKPFEMILSKHRIGFLLGHANPDAHFLSCFFLFVFFSLEKYKKLRFFISLLFYFILAYNGTRSAFIVSLLVLFIYSYLTTNKRSLLVFFLILLIIFTITGLLPIKGFIINKMGKEFDSFYRINEILMTGQAGGTLVSRIYFIWAPTINYITKNKLLTGFGANGWLNIREIIGGKPSHNLFVFIFGAWGLFGLIIWTFMFLNYFKLAIKNMKSYVDYSCRKLSIVIFCSWICYFNWCLIGNSFCPQAFTVFLILTVLTISIKRQILISNNNYS